MPRILLTGGGTGGHAYPLVAVVGAIKKIQPAAELYFLGPLTFGKAELESQGVRTYRLVAGKFLRYADIRWPLEIVKMPLGFLQALVVLFWIMPDVIFSKGGYGSIPVVLAARLYRIPVVIHESDAVPGLANALLARFARSIFISFPEAEEGFRPKDRRKIILTGNPVRPELSVGSSIEAKTAFALRGGRALVAVLGGSQGAERLNDLLLLSLPELLTECEVIHQTGELNSERVGKEGKELVPEALRVFWHPLPFLKEKDLRALYAASDLVVSRAGAGAIFEIAAAAKPSILIPLDRGSRGEQMKNAYAYARSGAAVVIEETNLTTHIFVKAVKDLLASAELRKNMSEAAKKFAKPEAAKRIAEVILENLG